MADAQLGATTYTSVTWTTGDVITEAKLDNMVANDQAYDSHAAQGLLLNNAKSFVAKDSGGNNRNVAYIDASDNLVLGDSDTTSMLMKTAWNGWIDRTAETWTRTGDHTFTISGDVTAVYRKGTRVRYKDGGSFEYGVVAGSSYGAPNTTVTLATNDDYAMAATTITDNYISYIDNPEGYPTTFLYTTTYTGFSSDPTGTVTRFSLTGNLCTVFGNDTGNGTSNSTTKTFTVPIAGTASRPTAVLGWMVDNNTQTHGIAIKNPSSNTTVNCYIGPASGTAWTASGNCRLFASGLTLIYEI